MIASAGARVKRYCVLCLGLVIMSFGVACSIQAGLGTSPISSLPYTVSQIAPSRWAPPPSPCTAA